MAIKYRTVTEVIDKENNTPTYWQEVRIEYLYFCLAQIDFIEVLPKIIRFSKLSTMWFLMKVIPDTRRAHYIWYLRIYFIIPYIYNNKKNCWWLNDN
jgi:hypothetical protein